jgi:hypothetical protein
MRMKSLFSAAAVTAAVAAGLVAGASPSQAAGESWRLDHFTTISCTNTLSASMVAANFDSAAYDFRTTVTSGGLVYMDQDFNTLQTDGAHGWGFFRSPLASRCGSTSRSSVPRARC